MADIFDGSSRCNNPSDDLVEYFSYYGYYMPEVDTTKGEIQLPNVGSHRNIDDLSNVPSVEESLNVLEFTVNAQNNESSEAEPRDFSTDQPPCSSREKVSCKGRGLQNAVEDLKELIDELQVATMGLSFAKEKIKYECQTNTINAVKSQLCMLIKDFRNTDDPRSSSGQKLKTRKSTKKSKEEESELKEIFQKNPKPSPQEMRQVAEKYGRKYKAVREWFSNNRRNKKQ